MAQVKWIKIVTDIFDDEKILMIEALPNADAIIVIWFKLLCLAGKTNNSGVFLMNEKVAYTDEMLSAIFRRDLNTVRMALKVFEQYEMIEIVNNTITIPNWSKHQTLDAYEKKKERDKLYQQNRREKQKLLAEGKEENKKSSDKSFDESSDSSFTSQKIAPLEEDKERDKDIDTITKVIVNKEQLTEILEKWNSLNLSKIVSIQGNRLKLLQTRIKEYGLDNILSAIESIRSSSFLKGQNNRNWIITFDWFIKPNNFLKVLEGNYLEKEGEKPRVQTYVNEKPPLRFNNFKAREYDYNSLEKKLLGWEDN